MPTVAVARYAAIGSDWRQWNVVCPCTVLRPTSTPLETAVRPCGTVMVMSYDALSVGWLSDGNQVMAPCGSFATNAPSSVGIQPSGEPSGSVTGPGLPW